MEARSWLKAQTHPSSFPNFFFFALVHGASLKSTNVGLFSTRWDFLTKYNVRFFWPD